MARKRCRGILASDAPHDPPLRRCKAEPLEDDHYCGLHAHERQRQDKLRAVLKPGWHTKLVAKRGRKEMPQRNLPPLDAPPPPPRRVVAAPAPRAAPERSPWKVGLPDRESARKVLQNPLRALLDRERG